MQEEKEEEITVSEILILMTEKMLRMEQELKVLNEKQNGEDDQRDGNTMQASAGSDASKQLTIDSL